MHGHQTRWLLPRHQTEYPARDLLPELTLHARRETTFLVLAAMFLVSTSVLVVLGTSRVIDLTALITELFPGYAPRAQLLLPVAVLPFAASFVANALVCELFGRRRASLLMWTGLIVSAALAGLMRVADLVDGGDAFGVSLAFVACYFVAHAIHLFVFDAFGRGHFFLRAVAAGLLGLIAGWTAMGFALEAAGGYLIVPLARATIIALAVGSTWIATAILIVLAIPAALVSRGLTVVLRVGHVAADELEDEADHVSAAPAYIEEPAFAQGSVARRLPEALIIEELEEIEDEDDEEFLPPARPPARPRTASIPPFSSAEMRFFTEGDAVAEG